LESTAKNLFAEKRQLERLVEDSKTYHDQLEAQIQKFKKESPEVNKKLIQENSTLQKKLEEQKTITQKLKKEVKEYQKYISTLTASSSRSLSDLSNSNNLLKQFQDHQKDWQQRRIQLEKRIHLLEEEKLAKEKSSNQSLEEFQQEIRTLQSKIHRETQFREQEKQFYSFQLEQMTNVITKEKHNNFLLVEKYEAEKNSLIRQYEQGKLSHELNSIHLLKDQISELKKVFETPVN
jgi:hypothetical protein